MKLTLDLNSEKDKARFYRLLPMYRTFSFIWGGFSFDTDDEDVKNIETALNLKNRKKRIEYVIDIACNRLDTQFKCNMNPCGFECGKCIAHRKNGIDRLNGCCNWCRFQSESGCTTKNVACKSFFCSEVKRVYKTMEFSDLKILKVLSWRQRCILKSDYFSSKEEVVGDLYSGIITVGVLRMISRLIVVTLKRMTK